MLVDPAVLSCTRPFRADIDYPDSLACCELYIATAALVLRVLPRMSLYETTVDDVRYDHDLIVSQPKKGSKGVRVVISQV